MAASIAKCMLVASSLMAFPAMAAPDVTVRSYNAPGFSDADVHMALRRDLAEASLQPRAELKGNATLDRSWDGAVLLKLGFSQKIDTKDKKNSSSAGAEQSVDIVCTTCYVKGLATAQLEIPKDFNATTALNASVESVKNSVVNFTDTIEDYFDDYFKGVVEKFDDGIDIKDFAFPQLNYSFALDVPPIPEVNLAFGFDGLELYLQTNTILGGALSYELNLFTTQTPLGIGIGKDSQLGVVFKVDLLLDSKGAIDISSGLHIKLDDGARLSLPLFSDKVSELILKGGQFEFLPVTVESADVILTAKLRIGIHAGIAVKLPSTPPVEVFNTTIGFPELKGGIEAAVYATLAEFTTNITATPDDKDCKLHAIQDYQFAVGGIVGASVAFGTDTWGPVAETSTQLYSTALASICALQATTTPAALASPTLTGNPAKRQAMTTSTSTTKIVHTGVQCAAPASASLAGDCPMSLQLTTQSTETRTLTASAPSGQKPTFAPSVQDTVTSTATFGSNAVTIAKMEGSPTKFTPPPPTPTAADGGLAGVKGVVEEETRKSSLGVKLGVGLGVGIPVLVLGCLGGFFLYRKRQQKKYAHIPNNGPAFPAASMGGARSQHERYEEYRGSEKKAVPGVRITEFR